MSRFVTAVLHVSEYALMSFAQRMAPLPPDLARHAILEELQSCTQKFVQNNGNLAIDTNGPYPLRAILSPDASTVVTVLPPPTVRSENTPFPEPAACVDVRFPLRGTVLPADYQYLLFAALSAVSPALHEALWLRVAPIEGLRPLAPGLLEARRGVLTLRLPVTQIQSAMALTGARIPIALNNTCVILDLENPSLASIRVAAEMYACRVTVKVRCGQKERAAPRRSEILERLQIQLFDRRIRGDLSLEDSTRSTLQIGGHPIVCYSARVKGLDRESAEKLAIWGLGGRRHFGCGFFVPSVAATGPREQSVPLSPQPKVVE